MPVRFRSLAPFENFKYRFQKKLIFFCTIIFKWSIEGQGHIIHLILFLNSIILSKLKVATNGKYLALRTITSTIIGEGVDTLIFAVIVFGGILPNEVLVGMIIGEAIFKVLVETLFTPITYKIIGKIKQLENKDVYDKNIKYTIF